MASKPRHHLPNCARFLYPCLTLSLSLSLSLPPPTIALKIADGCRQARVWLSDIQEEQRAILQSNFPDVDGVNAADRDAIRRTIEQDGGKVIFDNIIEEGDEEGEEDTVIYAGKSQAATAAKPEEPVRRASVIVSPSSSISRQQHQHQQKQQQQQQQRQTSSPLLLLSSSSDPSPDNGRSLPLPQARATKSRKRRADGAFCADVYADNVNADVNADAGGEGGRQQVRHPIAPRKHHSLSKHSSQTAKSAFEEGTANQKRARRVVNAITR